MESCFSLWDRIFFACGSSGLGERSFARDGSYFLYFRLVPDVHHKVEGAYNDRDRNTRCFVGDSSVWAKKLQHVFSGLGNLEGWEDLKYAALAVRTPKPALPKLPNPETVFLTASF